MCKQAICIITSAKHVETQVLSFLFVTIKTNVEHIVREQDQSFLTSCIKYR